MTNLKIYFARAQRTLVGALLPIVVPSTLVGIVNAISKGSVQDAVLGLVFFIWGAVIVGPYSLGASMLMEFAVNPRMSRDTHVYLIGGGLGIVVGALAFFGAHELSIRAGFLVGLPMGLLSAWYLRRAYVGRWLEGVGD